MRKTIAIFVSVAIIISAVAIYMLIKPNDTDLNSEVDLGFKSSYIRALNVNGTDYIFFYSGGSLFYVKWLGVGWSTPIELNLDFPVNDGFDCIFDNNRNEFHFFFCCENESTCLILHYSGTLDDLSCPLIVVSRQSSYGFCHPSAFVSNTGLVYLTYTSITGMTENINYICFAQFDGANWTNLGGLGIGNSPYSLEDSDGQVWLYSNLWTYTFGPQYCVDEWILKNETWSMNRINTSADGWNADPFVIEDENGTKYLFYNYNKNEPETKTDILMQRKMGYGSWNEYEMVVKGDTEHGIECPCATIHGSTINLYYINNGGVFMKEINALSFK